MSVMICRDSSRTHIHLAVLFICDVHALYAMDQSAMMAQDYVTIYGIDCILCVLYVLCCHVRYVSCCSLWTCQATRDDKDYVMGGLMLCGEGGTSLKA
jgi:hypothetical protein